MRRGARAALAVVLSVASRNDCAAGDNEGSWVPRQGRRFHVNNKRTETDERDLFCGQWNLSQAACVASPCDASLSTTRNLIVLHETLEHGAGLGDRSYIINTLVIFAQALCARVIIPPPSMMLSKRHNNNVLVDCSWEWKRYFDRANLSPLVVDWYEVLSQYPRCPLRDKNADFLALKEYVSEKGHVQAANMARAFDLFVKGVPFVLYTNSFGPTNGIYNEVMLQPSCREAVQELKKVPACKPNLAMSPLPLRVAADLVHGFERYLALHIRRTDSSVDGCDNSPSNVRLLLNCHLGEYNGDFPAIVMFTDETDTAYLLEVMAIMRVFAKDVVHLDAAAKVRLRELGVDDVEADNYLVYQVSSALRAHPSLRTPGRIMLEFGGHGAGTKERCDSQTRCERN